MRNNLLRFITWAGIAVVLTFVSMWVWLALSGGGQSTASLKWLQLLQTVGTFLLPPLLCAWLWDEGHRPFRWLWMENGAGREAFAVGVLLVICGIPAINLLADLNSRIVLPECLSAIEQRMRAMEDSAAALTERFLKADNLWGLTVNIGLMALLPALAEELSFRGVLQQLVAGKEAPGRLSARTHGAVWLTAVVFSAIHMQFYGFIPRMLLGALLGYAFAWTGCLWVPITMHFTNNVLAVVSYYILDKTGMAGNGDSKHIADTIGAGDTWWLGVLSLVAVGVMIGWITYRDPQGYARRTRRQ